MSSRGNLRVDLAETARLVDGVVAEGDEFLRDRDEHALLGGEAFGLESDCGAEHLELRVELFRRAGAYQVAAVVSEDLIASGLQLEVRICDGSVQVSQGGLDAHAHRLPRVSEQARRRA